MAISKEEFMTRLLTYERNKKIRKTKQKESEFNSYSAERCFNENKGKASTYRRINVNYDR